MIPDFTHVHGFKSPNNGIPYECFQKCFRGSTAFKSTGMHICSFNNLFFVFPNRFLAT